MAKRGTAAYSRSRHLAALKSWRTRRARSGARASETQMEMFGSGSPKKSPRRRAAPSSVMQSQMGPGAWVSASASPRPSRSWKAAAKRTLGRAKAKISLSGKHADILPTGQRGPAQVHKKRKGLKLATGTARRVAGALAKRHPRLNLNVTKQADLLKRKNWDRLSRSAQRVFRAKYGSTAKGRGR
jgi:hypothetical protein